MSGPDEIPRATPESLLLLRAFATLRRLAREAIIFGLMGWFISLAGSIYFILNQSAPGVASHAASQVAPSAGGTEDGGFNGSYTQGAPATARAVAKQTESPRHWPDMALLALGLSLVGYFVGLLVWAFLRMIWFAFHG